MLIAVMMIIMIMIIGYSLNRIMFAKKARARLSEACVKCSTLGYAPGPIHRLSWKCLPGTQGETL
jgi:hypothetical protein